ncbi:MAG: HAMP domain-containing histidine kinase [Propionibacteriaceae bacterium]|nr:HAMP domain-containing histidine kinase [Propionibacteriaceae bacterium]
MGASRRPGLSVRLKLTLSYAGLLTLAGALLIAVVWLLLRGHIPVPGPTDLSDIPVMGDMFPNRRLLLRVFESVAVVVLLFLLVVGLLGGWFLAGRMLAPLARITDATQAVAQGSLSHRIELPGRQDEFRALADSFDAMLARLEAHDAEQRRFAANASHELRTPLAITQTLLDVARDDPDMDSGELHERLSAVNARAIELTEALLTLSRADQGSFSQEPVDLSLIVEEAVETLMPLAEKRGVTVETKEPLVDKVPAQDTSSSEMTTVSGSPALLLQMTTNLLHNAIIHNLPTHGSVQVGVGVAAHQVTLTVENSGDGLDPELIPTLTEAFQRGTGRISRDQAGVGLGLAIIKSIVQAHAGTLALTPLDDGGLSVTVCLPAVPTVSRD